MRFSLRSLRLCEKTNNKLCVLSAFARKPIINLAILASLRETQ